MSAAVACYTSPLTRSPGGRRPILVIHGFGSSPRVMTPLGRFLEKRHRREVIQIRISPGFQDLSTCAHSAAERIDELCQDPDFEFADLVGYSMGGLVASYLLKRLPCGPRLRRVVTLGTPHRGTPLARLGTLMLGSVCKAVPQMRPGSRFLDELHAHDVPFDSELISVAGRSDLVVPEACARLAPAPRQRNYALAGVNHLGLLTARAARRCVSALLDTPVVGRHRAARAWSRSRTSEGVDGHLWRAEEPNRQHAGSRAGRRVPLEAIVAPGTSDHLPGTACICDHGDAAGKTDLSAVGMSGQHDVATAGRRQAIGLRRM